jgi:pyruvate,water dikinase
MFDRLFYRVLIRDHLPITIGVHHVAMDEYAVKGIPRAEKPGAYVVRGAPASAGEYAGKAQIVFGDQFDHVEAGAVVVCRQLPSLPSLFARAGALVVDGGGALANGAIIAREQGVPAVVGTYTATEVIRDGDYVAVDGTRGIITLLSRPRNQAPVSRVVSGVA